MKNSDKPAMPSVQTTEQYECSGIQYVQSKDYFEGLTKREHFAGLAMQGICASAPTISNSLIVAESLRLADALLAELDKE